MRRLALLTALASLLLAHASCLLVAGAGAGYVISRQIDDEQDVARVSLDIDRTWTSVQTTMQVLQDVDGDYAVKEFPRSVVATVDGCTVTVEVEAYDLDVSLIRVYAEKFKFQQRDTQDFVMTEILDDMDENAT